MTSLEIGLYSVVVVILLIAARMPIGVALGLVSFVGIAVMRGLDVAYGMLKTVPFDFAAHWELTAIPMFLHGLDRPPFGHLVGAVQGRPAVAERAARRARGGR